MSASRFDTTRNSDGTMQPASIQAFTPRQLVGSRFGDEGLIPAEWHHLARAVLYFGAALLILFFYGVIMGGQGVMALAAITGAGMVGSLALRRTHPRLMLTLMCITGSLQLLIPFPVISLLAIPLAVYSYARWVEGGRSRLVLIIGGVASLIAPVVWLPIMLGTNEGSYAPGSISIIVYLLLATVCGGLVVTPYAFGRRIRDAALVREQRRAAEAKALETWANQRENAQRMAEVNARSQIARELHDIVAHSLSVMIVQAEGGRALATKKPEAAAEVLGTIADTGRDALTEMRRIVDVLRGTGSPGAEYAPMPGLADIPEMVARAGDRVSLIIDGTPPNVPQTLGLTAFRIAQEGVTNVLKHAGDRATAEVRVHYLDAMIVVEVEDDGAGSNPSNGHDPGHGLRGMNERVAAMGGRLMARPKSSGGFIVRALLPIAPDPNLT